MKSLSFLAVFVMLPLLAGYAGAPKAEPQYARLVRGELRVLESGTTISRHKIVASADKVNGRGLTIAGTDPDRPLTGVTIQDCMIQGDGDDALSVSGNCRRIKIVRTRVMGLYQWPDATDYSRANKCFLAEGTQYYPDWLTVSDSSFAGGFRCPLIVGGVFRFERSYFGPSRRNVWTRPVGDIVDCEFVVQIGMKVAGGDNPWSDSQSVFVRPLCIEEPKANSLYFSGCTLTVLDSTGKVIRSGPASGNDLCRLWTQPDMVGVDKDIPQETFRTAPNRK